MSNKTWNDGLGGEWEWTDATPEQWKRGYFGTMSVSFTVPADSAAAPAAAPSETLRADPFLRVHTTKTGTSTFYDAWMKAVEGHSDKVREFAKPAPRPTRTPEAARPRPARRDAGPALAGKPLRWWVQTATGDVVVDPHASPGGATAPGFVEMPPADRAMIDRLTDDFIRRDMAAAMDRYCQINMLIGTGVAQTRFVAPAEPLTLDRLESMIVEARELRRRREADEAEARRRFFRELVAAPIPPRPARHADVLGRPWNLGLHQAISARRPGHVLRTDRRAAAAIMARLYPGREERP